MDTEDLMREFLAAFESRDASRLVEFLHEDVRFTHYGDPAVHGRDNVVSMWASLFPMFETVRFETVNQAVSGSVVLAEQFHYLGLKGREPAPIRNMAVYEIRDGLIGAWRDYTDSAYSGHLLDASRPIPSYQWT